MIDPNQNQTQFAFDLSGRLIQETFATGDKVKYTSNAYYWFKVPNAKRENLSR